MKPFRRCRELLISPGPGEWRAALSEDGVAVELHVVRNEPFGLDSIHLGRVLRHVPGLAAVLVDIGDARPGFLPLRDILPAVGNAEEGARLPVQVRREAYGDKAARLSTRLARRGRWLDLAIGRAGREADAAFAATDAALRLPVPEALGSVAPVFVRHGGDDLPSAEALLLEATALLRDWRLIAERIRAFEPPARLDPPSSLAAALSARLTGMPGRVWVEEFSALRDVRAAFPGAEILVEELPLDIEAIVDAALSDRVALEGGGSLHIEHTHAATLIDVDTGTPDARDPRQAALSANLLAAPAIARHMRLRNLSGGIVIDFVGIEGRGPRERVRAALTQALAADPAAPQALGWTRIGHFEVVRPRRGRSLADVLLEPAVSGRRRKNPVTVAHAALRAVARDARRHPEARWRLILPTEVAACLRGVASPALAELEQRLARRIDLVIAADTAADRYEIVAI